MELCGRFVNSIACTGKLLKVDLPGHQARRPGHMPWLAHPWLRHCEAGSVGVQEFDPYSIRLQGGVPGVAKLTKNYIIVILIMKN